MDAWNALTFWPLTATDELPDLNEWLSALTDLLGTEATARDSAQTLLGRADNWDELVQLERTEIELSGARKIDTVLANHPWLNTVRNVASDQGFFHWDLDFAAVFARGGFDLQVGNPPWVRPRTDLDALYSESDPWFSLAHKPTQAQKNERREQWHDDPAVKEVVYSGLAESVSTSAVLSDVSRYPHLIGQQPDLYRGFMERTWANASSEGIISLIHPESHFTEKKAAPLRRSAYLRLRRHWHFVNELMLFDIAHVFYYGVHTYGKLNSGVCFQSASHLYHPATAVESLRHDGSGVKPGFKDDNFHWDLRPHRDRVQLVTQDTLEVWWSILGEADASPSETRMISTVTNETSILLAKLAEAQRIRALQLSYSTGWHETGDKRAGYFETGWDRPRRWADAILQGPHLGVSTPMIKEPNPTNRSKGDWTAIDIEAMSVDFIPSTGYQPQRLRQPAFDSDFGSWAGQPQQGFYRVAWRAMAATTNFRTLYPTLIPPGATHVHAVDSLANCANNFSTLLAGTYMSSLIADFIVRSSVGSNLSAASISVLPVVIEESPLVSTAVEKYLRLNCLTEAYAPLWEELKGEEWSVDTPLRKDEERRAAQIEIDAIVALSLGVTADELCMIYRTQFPVMRRYDQEDRFDANGRKVPKEIVKADAKLKDGARLSAADRTWTHPQSGVEYVYEYPFRQLDREADMREAYARFEGDVSSNDLVAL